MRLDNTVFLVLNVFIKTENFPIGFNANFHFLYFLVISKIFCRKMLESVRFMTNTHVFNQNQTKNIVSAIFVKSHIIHLKKCIGRITL